MLEPHQVDGRPRVRRQGGPVPWWAGLVGFSGGDVEEAAPRQDDKCALAYSKVQVECDECRSCSIEAGTSHVIDAFVQLE